MSIIKIFKKRKNFKTFNQRGQTAVFFALLLPVLILFLFVVFDLGWLYLNKSRLQNAAEAAAIAGANKFCEESQDGYNSVMLVYENDDIIKALRDEEKDLPNLSSGINFAAKESWESNLGVSADTETDSWTKVKVSPTYKLYAEEDDEKIYYEVELKENVTHIFKVLDILPFTTVPAVAVAEITKGIAERNLWEDMNQLAETKTTGNWEEYDEAYRQYYKTASNKENIKYDADPDAPANGDTSYYFNTTDQYPRYYSYALQKFSRYFDGKWNIFLTDKITYHDGDFWSIEPIIIENGKEGNTSANGYQKFSEDKLDAINIDFFHDITFPSAYTFKDWNWDINKPLPAGITVTSDNNPRTPVNLRVHASLNFDGVYKTRLDATVLENLMKIYEKDFATTKDTDADPLYIKIESEPMVSELGFKTIQTLNTVRQIIININASNMETGDEPKTHDYAKRPMVIFYDGPEKNITNKPDDEAIRNSQPVILNLNKDFRGILFAPNSPVIIVGNDYKFEGFVIAESFKKLKTESDFKNDNYNYKEVVDSGHTIFFNKSNSYDMSILKTEDDKLVIVKKEDLICLSDTAETAMSGTINSVLRTDSELANLGISSIIDAELYNLTDYGESRDMAGNRNTTNKKAPAYVLQSDITKIRTSGSGWQIYKYAENSKEYKLDARNSYALSGYNMLCKLDGWEILCDSAGKKYIMVIKDSGNIFKDENNKTVHIERVKVKDAGGKIAYVDKSKITYINPDKIITSVNNDTINELNAIPKDLFFVKRQGDGENSPDMMIDLHGNVVCENLEPTKTYTECPFSDWKMGFTVRDFNLDDSSHYSRCGTVPKRRRYKALDRWEKGGEFHKDMFFTTERSKKIL